MNSAISGAGSGSHHSPRFRSQSIDPFACRDGLSRFFICSEGRPITCFLVVFIRDGSFDDQNKWFEFSFSAAIEELHEVFTVFKSEKGVMEIDFGDSRDTSQKHLFETRLGGSRYRNRISITTKAGCDPEHVDFLDRLRRGVADTTTEHPVSVYHPFPPAMPRRVFKNNLHGSMNRCQDHSAGETNERASMKAACTVGLIRQQH